MNIIDNIYENSTSGEKINLYIPAYDGILEYYFATMGFNVYVGCEAIPQTAFMHQNITYINPGSLGNVTWILCPNRELLWGHCQEVSRAIHSPIIVYDLATPSNELSQYNVRALSQLKAHSIFAESQYISNQWGVFSEIVPLGVPELEDKEKTTDILICGDYSESDISIVRQFKDDYGATVVGNNPGLSLPASSPQQFALNFSTARIYLNLSSTPRMTYELAYAMMAGCAIVSNRSSINDYLVETASCGALCDSIDEFNYGIQQGLKNYKEWGQNAHIYAKEHFNLENCKKKWQEILTKKGTYVYYPN